MPYVNSTAISQIEYNEQTMQMFVTFRDGGETYTFCGVPKHIYESFLAASSKGTFYHDHIKDRYQC